VRLGVLDLGSRAAHPLAVGAHRGIHPAAEVAVGTSEASRSPARPLPGAPSGAGPLVQRTPTDVGLRQVDTLDGTAQIDRSAQDASERLGRLTTYEARCTG
jgi:hypothetical protein